MNLFYQKNSLFFLSVTSLYLITYSLSLSLLYCEGKIFYTRMENFFVVARKFVHTRKENFDLDWFVKKALFKNVLCALPFFISFCSYVSFL